MKSINTFFEEISYKEIVASVVDVMASNFEDFAAEQIRFKETIALLEEQLEEKSAPSVSEMLEAIYQQIGSRLVFSCFLGLKANLDHYYDPMSRTFVDVDPEVYLRENLVRQLPDYQNAQHIQKKFYVALSSAQQELYEGISMYINYLETVGPKLAHYYGYILGNQLFPCVIPGYDEDLRLTLRYHHMLENYFGIRIKDVFCE